MHSQNVSELSGHREMWLSPRQRLTRCLAKETPYKHMNTRAHTQEPTRTHSQEHKTLQNTQHTEHTIHQLLHTQCLFFIFLFLSYCLELNYFGVTMSTIYVIRTQGRMSDKTWSCVKSLYRLLCPLKCLFSQNLNFWYEIPLIKKPCDRPQSTRSGGKPSTDLPQWALRPKRSLPPSHSPIGSNSSQSRNK